MIIDIHSIIYHDVFKIYLYMYTYIFFVTLHSYYTEAA